MDAEPSFSPKKVRVRGWDGTEMIHDFSITTNLLEIIVGFNDDNNLMAAWEGSSSGDITLMLSTGFRDKHGVEIFDGDLLTCGLTESVIRVDFNEFIAKSQGFDPNQWFVSGNVYETRKTKNPS
jgi:hypothetical protein